MHQPDTFFVYGTLRPGQYNFDVVDHLTVRTQPATSIAQPWISNACPAPCEGVSVPVAITPQPAESRLISFS